ncbi:MAG: type II secretion system protein [Elusimicrobia bacterium]|nr:type II secretion system protein [Elusimicrobiota bacterium]
MKNKKGFSLAEVIVTMMIIITLSLISFPIYRGKNHTSVKLAEGYALLGTIIDAQVAYYNEYGNFLSTLQSSTHTYGSNSWTMEEPIFGINIRNNRYFTNFTIDVFPLSHNTPSKYTFTAAVKSATAGTISMIYNLTQKYEPVVSGV